MTKLNNKKTIEKKTLKNFDMYDDTRIEYSQKEKQIIKNYFKIFQYENKKQTNENYLKKENLIQNYSLEYEIKSNANDMIKTFDDFEMGFYLADKNNNLTNKIKDLPNGFNKIYLCKQITKAMLNTYNNEMLNPDTGKLDFSIISEGLVSREPTPFEYVNNLYVENNEYIQNTINKIQVLKTKYTKTKSSNYKKQIEKEKENLKNFIYTI